MKRVPIVRFVFAAIMACTALGRGTFVCGQETDTGTAPKPAGRGIPAVDDSSAAGTNEADDNLIGWKADSMPLTGLQAPTLGNAESRHSYWVPGFQYGSTIQSGYGTGPTSGWSFSNFFLGNVSLLQQWSGSQLAVNYSGGGYVTNQAGSDNGSYQLLGLAQTFQGRRWQAQLIDQFSYLPVSEFGFGGGTNLGLPGAGGGGPTVPGIGGGILPNQSNYAAIGPRFSNTWITQLTYQTSSRGSITLGGSYALLHFTESGNVDTDTYIGNVGYNYRLSKTDTLGILYRFSAFHYRGEPQALGDHIVNLAYGKKIAKRLALQLVGGPEWTQYRIPIGGNRQTVGGNGGGSLTYAFEQGSVSANYFHLITGGGGVQIGSKSDQVSFTAGRRVARLWNIRGNFGFGKNQPLASQTGTQGNDYDSIYIGGGVDRPLTKDVNFAIAYTAQIQKFTATVCTGVACNDTTTEHVITLNLQWHTRPMVLP